MEETTLCIVINPVPRGNVVNIRRVRMIQKAKKAVLWFTKDADSIRTIWITKPTFDSDDESWGGTAEFTHMGTELSNKLFEKFAPNLELGSEGIKKVILVSQEDL